ncbi:methylated-DNA-[protein]-cysteine S-methyltransferase [Catalinimonas alkaloidigena]|uniref:Methylated-DNA--protein-cysteine methyltransferase n=1 Tax=Catalinimonas alkaloidigena TaxID=1075417 RepID=A0A1G8ZPN5_9BACT|nr:methylated-DNA--[protein]-cysteine S-methyltransferase [Catalinimonas alkaloidigena]SDK17066.1 methylated-DNA-[protein]-cysteine S-methyltransferase [Catalinimonas alkaloidigena]
MLTYSLLDSPIGTLLLRHRNGQLTHVHFEAFPPEPSWTFVSPESDPAARQVREYFTGERHVFDLDLAPEGTPFQQRVWQALLQVPYGATCSYSDLARQLGDLKAVRAVGAANGRNPIPIIIPCHRIIGQSGKLIGYAGGLSIKQQLLALERQHHPQTGAQMTLF